MSNVLNAKDANAPLKDASAKGDTKSMEYHRQVLQSKMAEQQYVSPVFLSHLRKLILAGHSSTSRRRTSS